MSRDNAYYQFYKNAPYSGEISICLVLTKLLKQHHIIADISHYRHFRR